MCFYVSKKELQSMVELGHFHPINYAEVMDEIQSLDPEERLSVRGEYYDDGESCSIEISTLPADADTSRYIWSYTTVAKWLAKED